MTRRAFLSFFAAALLPYCLTLPAVAQNAGKPVRLSPGQLIAEAEAHNGLGSASKIPWHVLARFERLDDKGVHKDGGTFEEWWFSPSSYKSIYKGETLNQTDIATTDGLFRSGDQRWMNSLENESPLLILSPLDLSPIAVTDVNFSLTENNIGSGDSRLDCVYMSHKGTLVQHLTDVQRSNFGGTSNPGFWLAQCFQPDTTVLRTQSLVGNQFALVFNDIVHFADRFVARDMSIMNNNTRKLIFLVHILELNPLPPGSQPAQPEKESTGPLKTPVELPGDRMRILSGFDDFNAGVGPAIPHNDTSTAKLLIAVNTQGKVTDVAVTGGTPGFSEVVAKQIHKIRYVPFVVAGTPVEVSFTYEGTFGSATTVFSNR